MFTTNVDLKRHVSHIIGLLHQKQISNVPMIADKVRKIMFSGKKGLILVNEKTTGALDA
jgi:hypothetical protein